MGELKTSRSLEPWRSLHHWLRGTAPFVVLVAQDAFAEHPIVLDVYLTPSNLPCPRPPFHICDLVARPARPTVLTPSSRLTRTDFALFSTQTVHRLTRFHDNPITEGEDEDLGEEDLQE